ncbi:uncharacterized protein LOC131232421 [Magnolia sinica]|uniref:uncharacterized protein LOC131232421 n=1 Tax=Magnolia sinica TaxID=86752 RepID=UPI00265ACDCD|nr:uncharacterized protein LOC131232421 [Magnolia sinica]
MPLSSSAAAVGLATDAMRNLSISLSSYPSPAVVDGIEGERNGGDGRYHFGLQLDLSIEREQAFRIDVIKNKGRDRSIPLEQTLEILKYISNEGEAAHKRLKESAMKVARYNPINTRSSTEFQQSPKELAFYRRGEIVERRARSLPPLLFHDNDDNNGGLGPSISSIVTEGLPKRSNLMETKRKSSKASDNASLLTQPHGSQPSLLQSVELRCHICQVHCMSAFNLQEHFQGKKHQEKCRQYDQQ